MVNKALFAPTEMYVGPHMAELTDLQQRFVIAMCETGGGNAVQAYLMAGPKTTNNAAARVAACNLLRQPKILLALREEADARCRTGAILGASVLTEIALDVTHKDRFKAATELLNRAGLGITQKIDVTHTHRDEAAVIERIGDLAKQLGVDPRKLLGNAGAAPPQGLQPIEGEFEVVADTTGLEDLL